MDDLKLHHDLLLANKELANKVDTLNEELRKARNRASDWKAKYHALKGNHITASGRARLMIAHTKSLGRKICVTDELVRIGKEVGLNYKTVRGLWYEKN